MKMVTNKNRTNRTNKGKQNIGFHEPQKALLCGKHALNNLLQEEKFVFQNSDETLINGTDPMGKAVKINVFNVCNLYEKELKRRQIHDLFVPGELMDIKKTLNGEPPQRNSLAANGKPDYKNNSEYKRSLNAFLRTKAEYEKDYAGKSDDEIKEMITDKIETYYEVPEDEICNLEFNGSQGMLPVLIMPVLLNMLNYSYRVYTTVSEPDNVETSVKKRVIDKMDLLENQACLGALINVGGTHWTAIVKYRKNCMEKSKQNGVQLYAYADSLVCGIKELDICYLLEDLKVYMTKKVDIQGAVFIFAKEDSYMSKAVQNKINGLGNRGTQRNVLGRKKWSKTMKR